MDKYTKEYFQACGRIGGLRKRPITSEEARAKANKRWEAYRAQKEAVQASKEAELAANG